LAPLSQRLSLLDDQGEPSKAAANAKRLLTQDNVSLLILSSLSSTYAPVIGESEDMDELLVHRGELGAQEGSEEVHA